MSRISELQSDPRNNINFIDILSLLCLDGKSKYVETLLRIVRRTNNLSDYADESKDILKKNYNIDKDKLSKYDDLQIVFLRKFLESVFVVDDLKMFRKFSELNENNQIEENDLSKYFKFADIENSVKFAELKAEMKKLEGQVHKIFENDTWLVVKPLTFEASKKYGAGTRWCTTTEGDPTQFNSYAAGILIYVINKKTNQKVAINKKDAKTNFWKSDDTPVNAFDCDLPGEILMVIKEDLDTCDKSNLSLRK